MHLLARADDRIDWARRQAFDAPDATIFVDDRNQRRALDAIIGVEWHRLAMKQSRQGVDGRGPTRWALVDGRKIAGNRLGIRTAPIVSTARALCLRQERVDIVGQCHGFSYRGSRCARPPRQSPLRTAPPGLYSTQLN
jgi:hypothetical protein